MLAFAPNLASAESDIARIMSAPWPRPGIILAF